MSDFSDNSLETLLSSPQSKEILQILTDKIIKTQTNSFEKNLPKSDKTLEYEKLIDSINLFKDILPTKNRYKADMIIKIIEAAIIYERINNG